MELISDEDDAYQVLVPTKGETSIDTACCVEWRIVVQNFVDTCGVQYNLYLDLDHRLSFKFLLSWPLLCFFLLNILSTTLYSVYTTSVHRDGTCMYVQVPYNSITTRRWMNKKTSENRFGHCFVRPEPPGRLCAHSKADLEVLAVQNNGQICFQMSSCSSTSSSLCCCPDTM